MLSHHVKRFRKHFHSFRHRLLCRLSRCHLVLSSLLLLSFALLVFLLRFPSSLHSLHAIHFQAYRPYTPRLLSSSFSPPSLLPLSYPSTDIDRPPSLRKAYDDALTLHADHSSVFSPAKFPSLDWDAVAEEDYHWANEEGEEQLTASIDEVEGRMEGSDAAAESEGDRHALLSSLLHYQFHPHDRSCSAESGRYLLYSFSSEFVAVSESCMSTHHLQTSQKPPHRAANKVSSVREIIEQMEKTAKLRQKLRSGSVEERDYTDVHALTDECRLDVLVDVVRALAVAQASRRELVLLPVQRGLCVSPMGESAGVASATWMGCAWPELLVRPSRCGWSEVKSLVDDGGYHEDPFSAFPCGRLPLVGPLLLH